MGMWVRVVGLAGGCVVALALHQSDRALLAGVTAIAIAVLLVRDARGLMPSDRHRDLRALALFAAFLVSITVVALVIGALRG
jgi:hypothetical protein